MRDTVGILLSLLSALLWSTTFVAARYLLAGGHADPATLSAIRFLVGGLLLLGVGLAVHGRRMYALAWRDYAALAGLGLFGIVGMGLFLFYGQATTSAINASVVIQLSPIFIAVLGACTGAERLRPLAVAGIALAFLGSLLVVGIVSEHGVRFAFEQVRGNLLVLASALCWAVYSVFGKRVVLRVGGYVATTWAMLAGAVMLWVWWLCVPDAHVIPADGWSWTLILYLAVFPTAVAFYAWYEAMRRIDLALLNVMQYLTPVCTILLAWVCLAERLGAWAWAGVALVAAGIALVGWPRRAAPKTEP